MVVTDKIYLFAVNDRSGTPTSLEADAPILIAHWRCNVAVTHFIATDVHQRAVELMLEVALFPKVAAMTKVTPAMPRHVVGEVYRAAVEAADPRFPNELSLLKLALSLERPDARWELLSVEQAAFYDDLTFRWEEDVIRVRRDASNARLRYVETKPTNLASC